MRDTTMRPDQLLSILWRRRLSFLATYIVVLGAITPVAFLLPKVYETGSYLLIAPERPAGTDFETTQISQTLTETYAELLQTRNVADEVQDVLGPQAGGGYVGDNISVEVGSGQLLKLRAEGDTPGEAQRIANTYARVFAKRSDRFRKLVTGSATVIVAETAPLPKVASRPRPKLYLLLGTVLALLAGAGMALLRQRLDQRLYIEGSDTDVLGVPVIARIPAAAGANTWGRAGRGGVFTARDEAGIAEAFRLLRVNLAFANLGEHPGSVAVVSASEKEGKSTCVLGLARAASETGISTLAVDADLRRPSLSAKLALPGGRGANGMSNLLAGTRSTLDELAISVPAAAFKVMTSGPVPPNPAALLAAKGFDRFHQHATRDFELVVYDTPPLAIAADASLVSAKADGVILVVDATRARRKPVVHAIDQLRRSQVNLLGVVLNRFAEVSHGAYSYAEPRNTGRSSEDPEHMLSAPSS